MDKLTNYRQYIQELLTEESQGKTLGGDIESETIFDIANDRYLLIDLGWKGHRRIYNCLLHVEIRKDKIWIQRNQTDTVIADKLMAKGVAKEDIILGLQPPYVREYTKFGVH
ncbi:MULTISPECIES: XisI protein [Calothrix]|uniref:XisI protein n=2 Tax=Calothrix TaxID=1186 RepID=A0ABR8A5R5_9CYAN|nr:MULTISPECIES: XisI protein [Calothrix]MBD2195194.1 XisI protein [Calothrix parietina FACHB-288]MBD2223835.1 XisI protein [Calothrix anomala FACHB-343]